MQPDIDSLLIRCSAIGKIMTQPHSAADKAAGKLGKTAQSYLHELYVSTKYGRVKEYSNKYIQKGLAVEEDAITLLTVMLKIMFKKNTERINNAFITGEPDIYVGDDILKASEGYDTKASFDIFTFPGPDDEIDEIYEWQNHGYMALTGAKAWTTAHCLVNATPEIIMGEKRKVFYALDCPNDEDPVYRNKCIEIEKNMIFDMGLFRKHFPGYDLDCREWTFDIPKEERVKLFRVERDENKIKQIYEQVAKCREHMKRTYLNILPPAQEEKKSIIKKRA